MGRKKERKKKKEEEEERRKLGTKVTATSEAANFGVKPSYSERINVRFNIKRTQPIDFLNCVP